MEFAKMNKNRKKNYDRVMSRVYNQSGSSVASSSNVIRHDISSTVKVGAKPSVSNISSGVFSDLPTVLNDYVPESNPEKVKCSNVVRPRRTVKSQDPAKSPPRSVTKTNKLTEKPRHTLFSTTALNSAPSLATTLRRPTDPHVDMDRIWSDSHIRQCYSSASHSKLRELKNEIKEFRKTEKMLKLRSKLYKQCGVVFDDFGQVAVDKGVQAEVVEQGYGNSAPLTNGSAGSPLGRAAGSPPVTGATGAGPSPMAALMSVADTLPPGSPRSAGGSPPQATQQRSNSRSSQHSPNSSGSNGGRRSSGSRHVSSTTSVSSTEAGEGAEAVAPTPAPLLKCTLCQERLEDTHFVQCPSQPHHKFCFPCSRDSIKRQQGSEVYCPSGEKCPLANSTVPWAFMQGEIATILGEEFKPKKERET